MTSSSLPPLLRPTLFAAAAVLSITNRTAQQQP